MKRKLLAAGGGFFGLIVVAAVATLVEPYLPMPVRQKYRWFSYTYLSVPPANREKYGVYEITPFDLDADIWVAFGDGGERHVYIYRPGGDDYRHATLGKAFHLRVNAPNSREAARLLRDYLSARGFRGSIRGACIFAHGSPGAPLLGIHRVEEGLLKLLSDKKPGSGYADLYFVSCDVAQGAEGRAYIQSVADSYGLRVNATEDSVGWNVWRRPPEGEANYTLGKENWLVASPQGGWPKRKVWPSAD